MSQTPCPRNVPPFLDILNGMSLFLFEKETFGRSSDFTQLMDLERFSIFDQVLAFSSLGGLRYALTRDRMTTFCFSISSSVVHLDVFLVISYMRIHVFDTSLQQD